MRFFLFFGVLLFCFSCKNENPNEVQDQIKVDKLDSLSKQKIKVDLFKLSPESEKDLESFEDFQNLRTLIQSLRHSNSFYVSKHADSLELLVQNFEENLSEDLNLNTINSRISVLSTEVGLLKLVAESRAPKSNVILEANTRLIKAYNSLIIQLNELSLSIPENIEKELLRELEETEN